MEEKIMKISGLDLSKHVVRTEIRWLADGWLVDGYFVTARTVEYLPCLGKSHDTPVTPFDWKPRPKSFGQTP
jgi:hypothetical protein